MRLAVVSPFVDRRHGTERALAEVLERLAFAYGCDIHLYSQRVEDLKLRGLEASPGSPPRSIVWRRVPTIPGPHILQFLSWIFLNRFLRWCDTALRKLSFDLVLSPGINGFDADVVIVHALFHRLQQLSHMENRDNSGAQPGYLRQLHRRVYYGLLSRMERRIYKNRKVAIATVSPRIAALLAEYFQRSDVAVIPNGVDTVYFSPAARLASRAQARERRGFCSDDFILLLIGNDWGTKGLATLLEALAGLQQIPIQLLVVGSDDPAAFRAKAAQLGVLKRCHWELPSSNVLDFYGAADLYASPSLEDSFGLPVLEAMACGLPAITSSNAGVSSLIQDGTDGFTLSDPRDVESLTKILRLLYEHAELRNSVGQAAAKTALQYSWDRNAVEVWALLQSVQAASKGGNSTLLASSSIM